jgi:hypothetical protein
MFSPRMSFRLPASDDMWMDYKPWTNWGAVSARAGSPQIEEEIFRDVALPGKQLGKLTDAVSALIEIVKSEHPLSCAAHEPAFTDLKALETEITLKKEDLKKTTKTAAERALDLLRRADPEAFRELVDKCRQDFKI